MMKKSKGFMYIELLVVVAVIAFIGYKVFNAYFKKPSFDQETQKVITEQGIDTTNYKSVLDSTRNRLRDIQNQRNDELNQIK